MKSKHTPGPWTTYRAGSFKVLVDKSSSLEIGQLSCTESEANLIAAAPEMLEALELAVNHASASFKDIHALNKCIAAIKKAKGEL